MIESFRAKWFPQYSSATSSSGRPDASLASIYGLCLTRFRSSWSPSNRKARSSYETKHECQNKCLSSNNFQFLSYNSGESESNFQWTQLNTCESCWLQPLNCGANRASFPLKTCGTTGNLSTVHKFLKRSPNAIASSPCLEVQI